MNENELGRNLTLADIVLSDAVVLDDGLGLHGVDLLTDEPATRNDLRKNKVLDLRGSRSQRSKEGKGKDVLKNRSHGLGEKSS